MECAEALRKLAEDAASGDLVFPTHAQVAIQVRLALDDPEIHLDQVAKLVQAEPMLAAKVVGTANSAAFNRSGRPLSDAKSAVTRLGVTLVRALSTAVILRQLSASPNAAHETLAERLWEHSAHVAALGYILAKRVSRQNPDTVLFAGIVHELVYFFLIARAAENPALLQADLESTWRDGGKAMVEDAVLKALAVPQEIADAIVGMRSGSFTVPPRTLADTLSLANSLTPILNPLETVSDTLKNDAVLALSTQVMADRTLAAILEESAEELDALAKSLAH